MKVHIIQKFQLFTREKKLQSLVWVNAKPQHRSLRMDILLIQMEFFENGIQEVQLVSETGPCPVPLRDANPSETQLKTEAAKQSVLF